MWKKILVIVIIILYDVSPVDLFPGPIDDLIVTVLGILWTRVMSKSAVTVDETTGEPTNVTAEPVVPANAVINKMNPNHKKAGTSVPKKM